MNEETPPKRRPGRPTEPGSLRETAKREGKTLWQVRKEREAEEDHSASVSCG